VKNPWTRLRELTGYGQREFERRYEFSHTVMAGIESGLYPDLSESMIQSLGHACHEKGVNAVQVLADEYASVDLQGAYHQWQSTERRQAKTVLDSMVAMRSSDQLSPMHFFVKDNFGSLRASCVALKVPTATMTRYVAGLTSTMPKVLEQALREAGMGKQRIELIQATQDAWLANR
jgi:hypothetical protein